MDKIDFKKVYSSLYKASARTIDVVEVPALNYLMVDGQGDPGTEHSFQDAIEALYALSYTLKFMIKRGEQAVDYGVLPLEGLWWADDMSAFTSGNKSEWKWTLMIMQPDPVTAELVDQAIARVREGKNPPALPLVRFESLHEGRSAQLLHMGPFAEEGPTIERLHAFIEGQGSRPRDRHHEIYLSDMRRAAPEKWKTIIRQPMAH